MEKQILSILARDARTTPAKIAVMIDKPEDEVTKAIESMEKSGVIRRYKTVIDWEKAGKERVFAFIDVSVTPSRGVGYDEIAKRVYEYPEVHSV